jgi:hypothetical protein
MREREAATVENVCRAQCALLYAEKGGAHVTALKRRDELLGRCDGKTLGHVRVIAATLLRLVG